MKLYSEFRSQEIMKLLSLTVPQVFATLHTPEIIATLISETITATAKASCNLNTQGTPLILFTNGPTA